MPDIKAELEYLQNLPLYETEKPYYVLLGPHDGYDPDAQRMDNLEYETHDDITIKDMRAIDPKIDDIGFQVLSHSSKQLDLNSSEAIEAYRLETEVLLRQELQAVFVKTYEVRKRANLSTPAEARVIDYNDPLLVEGPAKGAHNDVTHSSGPVIINRYLPEDAKHKYFQKGYRFRIVNTWRPLVPKLEDRPLALCDSRSVAAKDLMAADRVLPDRVGEVYYLTYNPSHKWYWLEKQTPSEPFVFVLYDTKAGEHSRFCPHVSFDNVRKSENAPPRKSVETRSVVISEE